MKIFKIEIENFRLLKTFSVNLEDDLSLIIGKNNTGKTSILSILDKFLSQVDKAKFSFDDFNIDFKIILKQLIDEPIAVAEADYQECGISLRLFIKYDEHDNLANVSKVMMDLDPTNNVIVLGFAYTLAYQDYLKVRADYRAFNTEQQTKKARKAEQGQDYTLKNAYDFLKNAHDGYFIIRRRSFEYLVASKFFNPNNFIDLDREGINTKDIVSFKCIQARRDVTNKEVDKTLSNQTSRIYKKAETSEEQNQAVDLFKDTLDETDTQLSGIYKDLFADIIKKIRSFGGIKINESEIEIISTLQHRELLEGNTTVVYKHDADNRLPEYYNGLGYMNLISMIFEIEILVHEFKRDKDKTPADINLLFIEEPEAHTHPQMQYVFIKNIKQLLKEGIKRDDGQHRDLQYVISTHSSCIVADSNFDDIKYLKKEGANSVVAKNLKDLSKDYDEAPAQYQFLKQYLTISRAEVFFADKVILIEGDTERILIPTLMRKVDLEEESRLKAAGTLDDFLPLLSQNISIIEVGAHAQIFDKFIEFLGIKTLLITDLDATDQKGNKCPVDEGTGYSNGAISHYLNNPTLEALKLYELKDRLINKVGNIWEKQPNGRVLVAYQNEENGYNARSFEDAFIHLNRSFITPLRSVFKGLKNADEFDDGNKTAYALADSCIKKKTHFALDILYHSDTTLSNWSIPKYIKDGLLWLKKD
jgi:predicted ATP-dependent endonuclease of OLD family